MPSPCRLDVSDNGKIAVGFTREGQVSTRVPSFGETGRGAISLIKYLTRPAASVVPDGWTLNVASLISADGNTIYGWGFNPDGLIEMFKVVLRLSATGS